MSIVPLSNSKKSKPPSLDTGELRLFASSNDNEVPLRNRARIRSLGNRKGGHDPHDLGLGIDRKRIPG